MQKRGTVGQDAKLFGFNKKPVPACPKLSQLGTKSKIYAAGPDTDLGDGIFGTWDLLH